MTADPIGAGTVLGGRYKLLRRLGSGGFGTVYEAEHTRFPGRKLAVKVIDPLHMRDERLKARFLREVEAASRLVHPNLIAPKDVDMTDDGVLFCTMDLSPGRSLRAVLAEAGGRLEPRRAVGIVRQVLDALAHAHDRLVVHRDVKPDNVMIERDGATGEEVAKVLDFGLAKLLDATTGAPSTPGMVLGTLQYLAPEQAKGEQVDGRADVYAAGVTLFELLTGANPFSSSSQIGFAVAHVTEPAPRLSVKYAHLDLPKGFDDVLARALAKEPGARYQTAIAFRDALVAAAGAIPAAQTIRRDSGERAPVAAVAIASPVRTITTPGGVSAAAKSESTFTTGTPKGEPGPAMPAVPEFLKAGTKVGRYVIESTIGGGGMGAVYKGRHIHMKRPAAIKVIQAELAGDSVMRARFLREARVASLFKHPNVVELYDFDEDGELCYLAMELVDGRPFDRVIREEAPLSLPRAMRIFDQMLDALAAAHAGGVVHRDLKPANIMIGPGDYVKILDFGIARVVEGAGGSASGGLTQLGDFIGTPAYASPEQIQGFGVDGRADLYAAGVILFETLAGRRPFIGKTAQEYLDQHLGSPPPALWEARPDLAHVKDLDAIVQKALTKDAQDRYQTAQEMREALHAAIGHLLPVDHAPTRRYDRPAGATPSGVMTAIPAGGVSGPTTAPQGLASRASDTLSEAGRTAAVVSRAVLLFQGAAGLARLFIVSGSKLAFGRSKEDPKKGIRNDIIVRALPCRDQAKDPENWAATVQVSHAHFEVAVDGSTPTAIDRSSRGTTLDGKPVPKDRPAPIPDRFALEVASPLLRLEGAVLRGPAGSSSLEGATDLGDAGAVGPIDAVVFRRTANTRDHAYALAVRSISLGRAPHAGVDVDAPGVAPVHARLTFQQGALCVEAAGGAAAPVTVEGMALPAGVPVPIMPSARVALGGASFTYREPEDADFTS